MARSAKQRAASARNLVKARARKTAISKAVSVTTHAGTITFPAGYKRTVKSGGSLLQPLPIDRTKGRSHGITESILRAEGNITGRSVNMHTRPAWRDARG